MPSKVTKPNTSAQPVNSGAIVDQWSGGAVPAAPD